MSPLEQIAEIQRLAFEHALIKYSGGQIVTPSKRKPRKNSGDARLNSHFTRSNSKMYPPLSEPYATRKRKVYGNKPILVASGRMKKSLVGRAKIFRSRDRYRMTFPNATAYAKYQESMGRPPTKPNKTDMVNIKRDFVMELKAMLRASAMVR